MVDDRIASRRAGVRAARRRARLRRTLLVVLLLALVSTGVWFERSEYATVRDVTVVGVTLLDPSEVEEASGVDVGDRALRLWPPRITERLEQLPLVRSADASRSRLRELVLTIEEREPVYVVSYRTTSVLVDREGTILARGDDARLPVVRVVTAPPTPGETVVSHAALANAHQVLSLIHI